MKSTLFLAYALAAYAVGAANILYIAGFLADIGVPKGIGDGEPVGLWLAIPINAALVGLFGLVHSLAARTSFKRWWTTIVPPPIERATYLLITAVMTVVLVTFWQPIPIVVWQVEKAPLVALIYAGYLAVWLMMSAATFHFGHFSFFGLAQAWAHFRKSPPGDASMTVRYIYALIRHPISLGWMLAPWLTPELTVGHIVFATATFVYIMIATPFEEADLIAVLGDRYRDYRKRVPAFLPFPRSLPTAAKLTCREAAND